MLEKSGVLTMPELPELVKEHKPWQWAFSICGIMATLLVYGILQAASDISPFNSGMENTVWGIFLMIGYLGFDGFTSTFQDKLFKGYDMEIHNQIFYTTLCSCILSFLGLIIQGQVLMAIDFVFHHQGGLFDVMIFSSVATGSQFFISYTIRTFGALTFATIMTTRQLVSIMLSCTWFGHPLSGEQWIGAAIIFGALYTRSFLKRKTQKVTTNPVHGFFLCGMSPKRLLIGFLMCRKRKRR